MFVKVKVRQFATIRLTILRKKIYSVYQAFKENMPVSLKHLEDPTGRTPHVLAGDFPLELDYIKNAIA
nr:MAG: hypothetical protein [uncultured cyanophage]